MSDNNEWGDLELFSNSGAKISFPTITISNANTINFNAGFFHAAKEQLLDNNYVELSYSKNKNAIVFKFTNTQIEKSSMKLTRSNNSTNGSIAARSFLNYYNIDQPGKYAAVLEKIPNVGNFWVVYLDNPDSKNE